MLPTWLEKYRILLQKFVDGLISPAEFERQYLAMFLAESTPMTTAPYLVLNELCGTAESYCSDPALRSATDVTEDELRCAASLALQRLADL
jgi:hypothetical protein